MQALHFNKSPWAALELHPTPFYSVYLFQVFSAVGNIFWLATDCSHFLGEFSIYEIQSTSLNHFICHMRSRHEYCFNACILLQVCLLVFSYCTRILLPDSLLYMGCFASLHVVSPSRTGLPLASIEKEGNIKNCKNAVKQANKQKNHNITSQDFTFTLFFKTQIVNEKLEPN